MHKKIKKQKKFEYILFAISAIITISILLFLYFSQYKKQILTNINILPSLEKNTPTNNKDEKLNLLFVGDIFLDRHIDELTQADNKKNKNNYTYPFQGLGTLNKQGYNAWIGNLECPVTKEQSTSYEKENYLKFSCKKEYLPELKKYFEIVSLANNHTNNMNGGEGLQETRKNLDEVGIKHFGDFDNSKDEEVCKIIYTLNGSVNFPIAYCGFHGVFSLPTEKELKVIHNYSRYFVTFVMPHQGVEYEPKSNTYQKKIYRQMIDNGADAVFGSHPHVIEEVETYKDKLIFYSLGNFIFDQSWSKTREHMEVETAIIFPAYKNNYKDLNCENLSNSKCLEMAEKLSEEGKLVKPEFTLKYKPIFTSADLDFITKKQELTEEEYNNKLRSIGFDRVASSSKI